MRKALLLSAIFALLLWWRSAPASDGIPFGVISQRSVTLTAQYWNPILGYVSRKTGLELKLKVARTGDETSKMIERGDVAFIYSNHFMPQNEAAGYRIFARKDDASISGQIVVRADSRYKTLADLAGKEIVFPSRVAFVGYIVPMDELQRRGIHVLPRFAGNQEGAMGQLQAGGAEVIAVNSSVMAAFAAREGLQYRVLWESKPYLSIPIAARPDVPAPQLHAVRDALLGMDNDPEGRRILAAGAELLKQKAPAGFKAAADPDYEDQKALYRKHYRN